MPNCITHYLSVTQDLTYLSYLYNIYQCAQVRVKPAALQYLKGITFLHNTWFLLKAHISKKIQCWISIQCMIRQNWKQIILEETGSCTEEILAKVTFLYKHYWDISLLGIACTCGISLSQLVNCLRSTYMVIFLVCLLMLLVFKQDITN